MPQSEFNECHDCCDLVCVVVRASCSGGYKGDPARFIELALVSEFSQYDRISRSQNYLVLCLCTSHFHCFSVFCPLMCTEWCRVRCSGMYEWTKSAGMFPSKRTDTYHFCVLCRITCFGISLLRHVSCVSYSNLDLFGISQCSKQVYGQGVQDCADGRRARRTPHPWILVKGVVWGSGEKLAWVGVTGWCILGANIIKMKRRF
jgi:hypothetical protein